MARNKLVDSEVDEKTTIKQTEDPSFMRSILATPSNKRRRAVNNDAAKRELGQRVGQPAAIVIITGARFYTNRFADLVSRRNNAQI